MVAAYGQAKRTAILEGRISKGYEPGEYGNEALRNDQKATAYNLTGIAFEKRNFRPGCGLSRM